MLSPLRYSLVRYFFVVECLLFVWFYMHGTNGMVSLWHMQQENITLLKDKTELATHVASLEQELATWDQKTLTKERIARETLHMARPSDTVYYWS